MGGQHKAFATQPSGPDRAASRAFQTLHDLRWFEVIETRGQIEEGQVAHYQVVVKVGFSLEGRPAD